MLTAGDAACFQFLSAGRLSKDQTKHPCSFIAMLRFAPINGLSFCLTDNKHPVLVSFHRVNVCQFPEVAFLLQFESGFDNDTSFLRI